MSFNKALSRVRDPRDYKALYEASQDELFKLKTADTVSLRERVASLQMSTGSFYADAANEMYNWITDTAKAKTYTKDLKKRKYTKRSNRWKKKSVKKSA
jgi:hypothetical protein